MKLREQNNNWRGGRRVTSHGYIEIKVDKEHHLRNANGYAYEHRVIAEQKLGRKLKRGERVHHKDNNKQNNHPDNIDVCKTIFHHLYQHRKIISNKRKPGEGNPIIKCKCGCGAEFNKYDQSNRPREFVSGHNLHKGGDANGSK